MATTPRPVITISAPSGILVTLVPGATVAQTPPMGIGVEGTNTILVLKPN